MPCCCASQCILLLTTLVLGLSPALACSHTQGRAEYAIHHETYGEVGRHVITFSCHGDDLVGETTIAGEVKVLMVPLFKRDATYREVWRCDRLIAFDSHRGRQWRGLRGARPRERRSHHHQRAPGPRRGAADHPKHPWNGDVIDRTLLSDTQRGRLQEVRVAPAGIDTITLAGRPLAAQKYLVTGDLERELWYDEAGNWLQSRLEHNGAQITLKRRQLVHGAWLGSSASGQTDLGRR